MEFSYPQIRHSCSKKVRCVGGLWLRSLLLSRPFHGAEWFTSSFRRSRLWRCPGWKLVYFSYDLVIILGSFAPVRPASKPEFRTFISSFKHWPMSTGQGLKFCPTSRRQVHNFLSSNYDALQTVEVEYRPDQRVKHEISISALLCESGPNISPGT